eukprot:COSAG06_NODE_49751_length_323_cov_0.754464_2_plen_87_part_01
MRCESAQPQPPYTHHTVAARCCEQRRRLSKARVRGNYYKHKSVFDEAAIIKHLPPSMATELVYCIYHETITNCTLFRGLRDEIIQKI